MDWMKPIIFVLFYFTHFSAFHEFTCYKTFFSWRGGRDMQRVPLFLSRRFSLPVVPTIEILNDTYIDFKTKNNKRVELSFLFSFFSGEWAILTWIPIDQWITERKRWRKWKINCDNKIIAAGESGKYDQSDVINTIDKNFKFWATIKPYSPKHGISRSYRYFRGIFRSWIMINILIYIPKIATHKKQANKNCVRTFFKRTLCFGQSPPSSVKFKEN